MDDIEFTDPEHGSPWTEEQARDHLQRSHQALNAQDVAMLEEARRLALGMFESDSPILNDTLTAWGWRKLTDAKRLKTVLILAQLKSLLTVAGLVE